MSSDESTPASTVAPLASVTDAVVEEDRSEKILRAKELYSHGSRNFLVKCYAEAADELSEVCALYEELYGELSDELGMPYLLYAKSLIALAMDENKVIDVPDEEEEEDDDDESDEADSSTAVEGNEASKTGGAVAGDVEMKEDDKKEHEVEKAPTVEEAQVSSSADDAATSGKSKNCSAESVAKPTPVADGEKPSTSNGDTENGNQPVVAAEEEEDENASCLQLAWEILELAAKIFSRQGMSGLPNLAEVQTELANIEFENNIVDAARDDYEKALQIYKELPTNYRRAMAEIYYKIGLTHLMQNQIKEAAASLKDACNLIEGEIEEMKAKPEPNEKDKNNIQDMEETKQEIWAKIAEIEEAQAQNVAEVRAALDSYIKPIATDAADGAGPSSSAARASASSSSAASSATTSAAAITSSSSTSKPTNISHLIKRKKPEEPSSEAEAAAASSPAKRPAV